MKSQNITMHWFHWLIITFSILLTLFAWYFSHKQVTLKVQSQFEREAQQVIYLIQDRLTKYEDALWAGVATIHANKNEYNYDFWKEYVSNLNLLNKYPGVNGIGVIEEVRPDELEKYITQQKKYNQNFTIHPKHSNNFYFPISYVFPIRGNAKAIGLDMAHEANRLQALMKARNTGKAQITGPITLVQDKEKTPGFLFYTPFYQLKNEKSEATRQASFIGAVYAPFIMKKLMQGVLDKDSRQVSLKISDDSTVLYSEFNKENPNYIENSTFRYSTTLPVYGRQWQVNLKGAKSFEKAINNNQPLTILIAGCVIDSLLIFLFFSISNANKHAVELANIMTQDLQEKTQLLKKSSQYKSEFLSNMSHELRTPLNSIILLSQLLMKNNSDRTEAETIKMLRVINKSGHTLLHLVNDILDLAKIESGKMDVNISNVFLSDIKACMTDEFQISAKEKSLQFHVYLDDKVDMEIETDADKLLQVLRNFLSNALKFTEEGEINLTIRRLVKHEQQSLSEKYHNGLAFSVKDTGIGLSSDQQKVIFEAFTQIDGSLNRQYDGTGLGLNICKNLASLLGGEIKIISELGAGAEFILYLPRGIQKT